MQVFKRINLFKLRRAQNLIEFVFVFPTLLILTLVIFEVALFWQDANIIYSVNSEINANVALDDYSSKNTSMVIGQPCPAATRALAILQKRDAAISKIHTTYTGGIEKINGVAQGEEPFALYKYTSNSFVTGLSDANGNPQAVTTLWVDCRNPFENGITTQIEFYHKNLIMRASIPRFDSPDPIVIIPDNILIASPKLNTIRHY